MKLKNPSPDVSQALLDAIRGFPSHRDVEHCGVHFSASPFDIYADCPQCGQRIKLRSYSGAAEIEDVFDAVFEWLQQPQAEEAANNVASRSRKTPIDARN